MNIKNTFAPPFSPLSLYVLAALYQQDLHPYAIMNVVIKQSLGTVAPSMGSVVQCLQRLEAKGFVIRLGDERRTPYVITRPGEKAVEYEIQRLQYLAHKIEKVRKSAR